MRTSNMFVVVRAFELREVLRRLGLFLLVVALVGLSQACGGGGGGGGSSTGTAVTAVRIVSGGLPDAAAGSAYSTVIAAVDGDKTSYDWSLIGGSLPPGLNLGASGVPAAQLSGTPTTAGTYSFTVLVRDASGSTDSASYTLEVRPVLTITTSSLLPTSQGTAFSQPLTASGGSQIGFQWTLTAASGPLPAGVSIAPSGTPATTIGGTPVAAGSYPLEVQVTDTLGVTATKQLTLTVRTPPTITTPSILPATYTATTYSQTFTATGGSGTGYVWGRAAGVLPTGITMPSPATGTSMKMTGNPSAPGTYIFSLEVVDSDGSRGTAAFSITISANVTIPTTTLPPIVRNAPYAASLTASGGTGTGYTFYSTGTALPVGITLSSAGVFSGTTSAAKATINGLNFRVIDSGGNIFNRSIQMTINDPLAIVATTSTAGMVGVPYTARFVADQGTLSGYSWSLAAGSGSLPGGVSFTASDTSTCRISGVPTQSGSFPIIVRVTDGAGNTTTSATTLTINPAANTLEILTRVIPSAISGTAFSLTLAARGGQSGSHTWSSLGALPPGLTLASNGALSGLPTTPGLYPVSFTVTDGASVTRDFVLLVKRAPRWAAYVSDQEITGVHEAFIADINGATPATPARNPWPSTASVFFSTTSEGLQLSPDNSKAAFVADLDTDGKNDLYVVDLRGAAPSAAVAASASVTIVSPTARVRFLWSPDSNQLAFTVTTIFDANGNPQVGTLYLVDVSNPAAPGTPRKISNNTGTRGIINASALSNSTLLFPYAFAPDGSKIGFLSDELNATPGNWDLFIASTSVPASFTTFQQNAALGTSRVGAFNWTDSNHVVYGVRLSGINGGFSSFVVADVGLSGRGTEVAVMGMSFGTTGLSSSGVFALSPDLRRLLVLPPSIMNTSRKEIFLADLEHVTTSPTAVRLNPPYSSNATGTTFENVANFVWSPDARRIGYKSSERGTNVLDIFIVDVFGGFPGGAQVASTTPLAPFFGTSNEFSFSPDGTKLVMLESATGKGNPYIVDVSGALPGGSQLVTQGFTNFNSAPSFVTFSPDSRKLSFRAAGRLINEFELYVSDLSGASPAPPVMINSIPPVGGNVSNQVPPAWSYDSSRIFFMGDLLRDNFIELNVSAAGAPFATTRLSGDIAGVAIYSGSNRGVGYFTFQN